MYRLAAQVAAERLAGAQPDEEPDAERQLSDDTDAEEELAELAQRRQRRKGTCSSSQDSPHEYDQRALQAHSKLVRIS